MIHDSFEELKISGKLPTPSGIGLRVIQLAQKEDTSAEELGRTIQADPALTGRILKVANSTANAGVQGVHTVAEAAMRLGARTVSNVALGFTLISGNRSGLCKGFDFDRFWAKSLARALAAEHISETTGALTPAECFSAGLLSHVGRLALASVHPEEYAEILRRCGSISSDALAALERKTFQIDHGEVAASLLEEWGLPESFGEAIQAFESYEPGHEDSEDGVSRLTATLSAADTLADLFLVERRHSEVDWSVHLQELETIRGILGMEVEEFEELAQNILTSWTEWCGTLRLATQTTVTPADVARRASDAPPIAGSQEREAGSEPVKAMSILLAHVDLNRAEELASFLGNAGFRVQTTNHGKDALRIAMEQTPQVLLASSNLEGMSGLELCRSLRSFEAGSKMFFVVLAENNDEDYLVDAFDSGVDDCVDESASSTLLLARIKGGQRVIELQDRVERDKSIMRKQVADLGVLARRLRAASLTDSLTELPNRRYAIKRLEQEWASAERNDSRLSAIMLDIDHFKRVNDEHGHDAGDEVLREVAKILRNCTRKGEEPCRLGGEEFLVILKGTGIDGAARCAERIRSTVENRVIQFGDFNRNVTLSLGVAERLGSMDGVDALLKASDEEVYRAKASGRNQVCVRGGTGEELRETG